MISGTRNHSSPVMRMVAISVAPQPVPMAPKAPWVVVWLSVATTIIPGRIRPASGITWWQTPQLVSKWYFRWFFLANSRICRWLSALFTSGVGA